MFILFGFGKDLCSSTFHTNRQWCQRFPLIIDDEAGSMTFFWLIFMFIGFAGMGADASLAMTVMKSSGWPKTKGRIISSVIIDRYNQSHSKTTYTPAVTYAFFVNGREYRSTQVSTGTHGSDNFKQAQIVVDTYVPNMEVEVFYNPNDPDNAVLEPGFENEGQSPIICFIVSIMIAGTHATSSQNHCR